MTVRVRFAPSPSGQLHVGNARTALFNWLFARRQGGAFVLRIEDTDSERIEPGAEARIFEDLTWLGIDWDEGPVPSPTVPAARQRAASGPSPSPSRSPSTSYAPYRQSERGAFYASALARLAEAGRSYPCFCSDALLEADRAEALAAGRTTGYVGRCRTVPPPEAQAKIASGAPHTVRFRASQNGVVRDILRGEVDFRSRPSFDIVLRRTDGRPTYNFAVVVDDVAMAISHVIRGEDHLTNTALQLQIYEALGAAPPLFAHLPLLVGPDGVPLSKRHGASSLGDLRARGFPPEGAMNALALLGWTPPDDRVVLTRDEMIEAFDLAQLNASPAVFDEARLAWISGQKIRAMDRNARGRAVGEALEAAGLLAKPASALAGWIATVGDLLATSLSSFNEAPGAAAPILAWSREEALAAGALEAEHDRQVLDCFAGAIEAAGGVAEGGLPAIIAQAKARTGLSGRPLLHPLRAAISGQASGPELARLVPIIEEGAKLGAARGMLSPAARIRAVLEGA